MSKDGIITWRFLLIVKDTSNTQNGERRHGGHGTFLSSLAAVSVLTVTSHHQAYDSTNTMVFHHSRPVARLIPAPTHHFLDCRNRGTRVGVQDLFGNMPVRVKHRALIDEDRRMRIKDWETLCHNITGMLLAWSSPVSIHIKGSDKDQNLRVRSPVQCEQSRDSLDRKGHSKTFDLGLVRGILIQGAYVEPSIWETWVKTSARTPFLTIRALISLQPAPSKGVQFICFGVQHLRNNYTSKIFYDAINNSFASSSFGIEEEYDELENATKSKDRRYKKDGFTNKQLKGGGKGIDRWPMFFIQIECNGATSLNPKEGQILSNPRCQTESILSVLEAMISGFLREHHFRPWKRRVGKRKASSGPTSAPKDRAGTGVFPPSEDVAASSSIAPTSRPPAVLALTNRSSTRREATTGIGVGDLVNNVKVPHFKRARTSESNDGFSSWSRIKCGSRAKIGVSVPEKLVAEESTQSSAQVEEAKLTIWKESDDRTRHASITGPLEKAVSLIPDQESRQQEVDQTKSNPDTTVVVRPSDVPEREPRLVNDDEDRDPIVDWTNPLSKITMKINARTGLVIDEVLDDESMRQVDSDHQRPQSALLAGPKRLTSALVRSISAPSRIPKIGSWTEGLLASWVNPVFHKTEESIPRVSLASPVIGANGHGCSHSDIDTAFKEASSSFAAKLSKEGLRHATVLAQVDTKFILVKMNQQSVTEQSRAESAITDEVLVLIDQHAADERIRIETLLAELCRPPSPQLRNFRSSLGHASVIDTVRLTKPLKLIVPVREHTLFTSNAQHFANWGILFESSRPTSPTSANRQDSCTITILSLPPGIAERCRLDPKQLTDLMRAEIWKLVSTGTRPPRSTREAADKSHPNLLDQNWLKQIGDCPHGILDMLNSRSCRSAIMFNDKLSLEECEVLVAKLADCAFPFQCAHGRPSMVPLVGLGSAEELVQGAVSRMGSLAFGTGKDLRGKGIAGKETSILEAWRRWKGPANEGVEVECSEEEVV